jgi:hypothetical protein
MENYLVDLLNEVAARSLTPFKSQDKIVSFSQAHLLSFDSADQLRSHLIKSECRALSGKGFRDFEKYYKRHFNVIFSQAKVSIEEIDGVYARRHLLVHAGGVIDKQFQKKFAPNAHPGQSLEIPEDYFLQSLTNLEILAEYCSARIEVLFPKKDDPEPPAIAQFIDEFLEQLSKAAKKVSSESPMLISWFGGVFRTRELLDAHFGDNSSFHIDEVSHSLNEILVGKKRTGERAIQWLVCGEKAVVGPYIAYLEYLSRRGMLEEFEKHTVQKQTTLLKLLSADRSATT